MHVEQVGGVPNCPAGHCVCGGPLRSRVFLRSWPQPSQGLVAPPASKVPSVSLLPTPARLNTSWMSRADGIGTASATSSVALWVDW